MYIFIYLALCITFIDNRTQQQLAKKFPLKYIFSPPLHIAESFPNPEPHPPRGVSEYELGSIGSNAGCR
jgi:hypothetical protein